MNYVSYDMYIYACIYHFLRVCAFSLGYSSTPEWLEPIL